MHICRYSSVPVDKIVAMSGNVMGNQNGALGDVKSPHAALQQEHIPHMPEGAKSLTALCFCSLSSLT